MQGCYKKSGLLSLLPLKPLLVCTQVCPCSHLTLPLPMPASTQGATAVSSSDAGHKTYHVYALKEVS